MTAILLVDDHAIVRSGIRRLLAGLPALQLSEAASGEEALEQVRGIRFQLLILDLNLPGLGGLELLRRLLKTDPALQILVFSLHTEAIYATRAMEAGARGFVSKNAAPEELLAAIDTVLAGGTVIEQGETACCYAKSEKSWIDDPAGISWETFHTTGDSISYGDGSGENDARVAHAKACCVPQAAPAAASACCK